MLGPIDTYDDETFCASLAQKAQQIKANETNVNVEIRLLVSHYYGTKLFNEFEHIKYALNQTRDNPRISKEGKRRAEYVMKTAMGAYIPEFYESIGTFMVSYQKGLLNDRQKMIGMCKDRLIFIQSFTEKFIDKIALFSLPLDQVILV